MGKGIRQILQDDPARDIRKAFLEHRAVMPNVPTNIDECWQLGIPVFRLGSNGVLIQPAPPDGLLHSHVADKSTHLQWVLGKPGVRVQIGVVSWLEYCVFTIGNILIFVRAQESGISWNRGPQFSKLKERSIPKNRYREGWLSRLQVCDNLLSFWSCQIPAFLASFELVDTSFVDESN